MMARASPNSSNSHRLGDFPLLLLLIFLPLLLSLPSPTRAQTDPNDSLLCLAVATDIDSSYGCLSLSALSPYTIPVSASLKALTTPSTNVSLALSEDSSLFCLRFIGSNQNPFSCIKPISNLDFPTRSTAAFSTLPLVDSKISIFPYFSPGTYGIAEALQERPTVSTVRYYVEVQNTVDSSGEFNSVGPPHNWNFSATPTPSPRAFSLSALPYLSAGVPRIYALVPSGYDQGVIDLQVPYVVASWVNYSSATPFTAPPLVASSALNASVLLATHLPGTGQAFSWRHRRANSTDLGLNIMQFPTGLSVLDIHVFTNSPTVATVLLSDNKTDYQYTFNALTDSMGLPIPHFLTTPMPYLHFAISPDASVFVVARCNKTWCSLQPYSVLSTETVARSSTSISLRAGADGAKVKFAISNLGVLRLAYVTDAFLNELVFAAFDSSFQPTITSRRPMNTTVAQTILDFQVGPGPDPISCAAVWPDSLLICAKSDNSAALQANPALLYNLSSSSLRDVKFLMALPPSVGPPQTATTPLCPNATSVCTLSGSVSVSIGETFVNLPSTIGGSITISSTLNVNNSLAIGANLTLATGSTIVISAGAPSVSPINVSGCAYLAGQLVLEVPPNAKIGDNSFNILNASCIYGTLSDVQVKAMKGCQQTSNARPVYSPNQLSIAFSLSSTCLSDPQETGGFIPGLNMTASLAVAIAVPLVLILIVVAAVLLINPTTRKKLFPFRDREHYEIKTRPPTSLRRDRTERV